MISKVPMPSLRLHRPQHTIPIASLHMPGAILPATSCIGAFGRAAASAWIASSCRRPKPTQKFYIACPPSLGIGRQGFVDMKSAKSSPPWRCSSRPNSSEHKTDSGRADFPRAREVVSRDGFRRNHFSSFRSHFGGLRRRPETNTGEIDNDQPGESRALPKQV